MKKRQTYLIVFLVALSFAVKASSVDTIDIASAVMNKTYKAAVVLPASYATGKGNYPVLYLLHGGGGHFRDWLNSTPDKMLVKNMSDQYNLIIVMPEGGVDALSADSKNFSSITSVPLEIISGHLAALPDQ